jgi:hypothetical protein
MWPDVARRLPTLAPNLAPRKLISSANDRPTEQAADPPPPKPIFPAISLFRAVECGHGEGHLACYASPGTPRTRDPLTLYLGTSSL